MKIHNIIKLALIVLLAGIIPANAHAASVYMEASRNTMSVGDTAVVTIKINSQGAVLNTIDGDIAIKTGGTNVSVQEFSLANSSFGLWPRTPSLSKDGLTISFVGGVPGGFNIEGATVFKVVLLAKKEGTVTIAPQNISVYANDGKGTKVPVDLKGLNIVVTTRKSGTAIQNDWSSVVSSDITPPNDFVIVLGQDSTMFDGKKFAFFSALDNQSGIAYYEVTENTNKTVRSGSTYVLQNQTGPLTLNVIAYDKAGNKKATTYVGNTTEVKSSPIFNIKLIAIVVAALIFIVVLLKLVFRRKNKNVSK